MDRSGIKYELIRKTVINGRFHHHATVKNNCIVGGYVEYHIDFHSNRPGQPVIQVGRIYRRYKTGKVWVEFDFNERVWRLVHDISQNKKKIMGISEEYKILTNYLLYHYMEKIKNEDE